MWHACYVLYNHSYKHYFSSGSESAWRDFHYRFNNVHLADVHVVESNMGMREWDASYTRHETLNSTLPPYWITSYHHTLLPYFPSGSESTWRNIYYRFNNVHQAAVHVLYVNMSMEPWNASYMRHETLDSTLPPCWMTSYGHILLIVGRYCRTITLKLDKIFIYTLHGGMSIQQHWSLSCWPQIVHTTYQFYIWSIYNKTSLCWMLCYRENKFSHCRGGHKDWDQCITYLTPPDMVDMMRNTVANGHDWFLQQQK